LDSALNQLSKFDIRFLEDAFHIVRGVMKREDEEGDHYEVLKDAIYISMSLQPFVGS
jgi:hypothetical protein